MTLSSITLRLGVSVRMVDQRVVHLPAGNEDQSSAHVDDHIAQTGNAFVLDKTDELFDQNEYTEYGENLGVKTHSIQQFDSHWAQQIQTWTS